MGGEGGIEQDTNDMDAKATADQVTKYKDTVVGVKSAHSEAGVDIGRARAVRAGTMANVQ